MYEIITIINLDLAEEGARKLSEDIKNLLTSQGGKVVDGIFWGKRKFAYQIKGKKEGFYDVITFEMEPKDLPTLKDKLNMQSGLNRYLITARQ